MTPSPADAPAAPSTFQVHACSWALRLVGIALQGVCVASLLVASWLVLFDTFTGSMTPTPPAQAGRLVLLALFAFGLIRLLRGLTRATLRVTPGRLVLERRGDRFEIPLVSVESVRVWWIPLPGAGLSLRMRSGRGFGYGLQVPDLLPVLNAFGQQHARATVAARSARTAFALARASIRRRRYALAFKFGVFSLLPAAIVFQLNQRIVYGGPFAQYQMYGLGPYLRSFAVYWAYATAGLVLYACACRVLAELLAFGGACISPPHARGVRRLVEMACALLYYLGFTALLTARILL